jgi:hypothetical protein
MIIVIAMAFVIYGVGYFMGSRAALKCSCKKKEE